MNKRQAKKLAKLKAQQTQQTPKQVEILDAKANFLDLYQEYGTIGDTLAAIGLKSRTTFYEWISTDIKFKADFEEVKLAYVEKLEKEADRRATEGVIKPLLYKGKPVTDKDGRILEFREYSDTLLIFRLKALDPAKYRERISAEVTKVDNPIENVSRVIDD